MTDLRWFLTVLLPLLLLPTFAQQKADTTYTFRFVPQKDMFYVPWNGNGEELERLLTCVKQNRHDILGKKLPVLVDGYCNSHTDRAKNLATAKIRANRVKTELILRAGLTEDCFVTHNHATEGDYVTVGQPLMTITQNRRLFLRADVSEKYYAHIPHGRKPLPTARRKQKARPIIISPSAPTCCAGLP